MPILSVGDLAQSWNNNQVWRQHWHKTASPVTTGSGFWLDLSMAAGTPKYNPYVGDALAYTPLVGGSNNGINAGLGGDSYITRYNLGGGGQGNGIWPASARRPHQCPDVALIELQPCTPLQATGQHHGAITDAD
jgi:hypothetical protein